MTSWPSPNTHLATVALPWDCDHPWPLAADASFATRGDWPARWIALPEAAAPVVCAYRLRFTAAAAERVRIYASADERYDLFLDGVRIGRGPERGSPEHWYYDGYDLDLSAGEHVLVARVWSLGVGTAPWSTLGLRHGFLLAAGDARWNERLATGAAPWRCGRLEGVSFVGSPHTAWSSNEHIDGAAFPWGFVAGEGENWGEPEILRPGRTAAVASFVHTFEQSLRPARLPRLFSHELRARSVRAIERLAEPADAEAPYSGTDSGDIAGWSGLVDGEAVRVMAGNAFRVLLDLGEYRNVFPRLAVQGGAGARVELAFAEALHVPGETQTKGNRNEIAGKVFPSTGSVFLPDGPARTFEPLWWRAGRYVQLVVTTADADLLITELAFEETGYPYPEDGTVETDDAGLAAVMDASLRTARRCARESFMDCPFYEQQQWVGDMRVQMLIGHAVLRDSRLIRRCIEFIGDTRKGDDMVFARYPAPQRLWIPSFALAWCGMVYDLARWRGERAFVAARMPALRSTLDRFLRCVGDDGLLRVPAGWNFTDWAKGWAKGEPCPAGAIGALLQWWLIWVLDQAAELDAWLDEPELATRWRRRRDALVDSAIVTWWNDTRGLIADDATGTRFCELTNALAVLGGRLPSVHRERLRETLPAAAADVTRCTFYTEHYLFDAYANLGRIDALEARLERYKALTEVGLSTMPETPEPTRSDCHAWSAHPRYHAIASQLGIRPDAFGFARVRIRPQLGSLPRLAGSAPHPAGGVIACRFERSGDELRGTVTLPDGVDGVIVLPGGQEGDLAPGVNQL